MKTGLDGWQFGSHTNDSRGIKVSVKRTYWWQIEKQTRREMKKTPWFKQISKFSGVYGLILGTSFFVIRAVFDSVGLTQTLSVLLSFCFASVMGFVVSKFEFQPMLQWMTNVRLANGECGCCQYPLVGCFVEPDGCTVCPECGAAWKLPVHDEPEAQARGGAHSG